MRKKVLIVINRVLIIVKMREHGPKWVIFSIFCQFLTNFLGFRSSNDSQVWELMLVSLKSPYARSWSYISNDVLTNRQNIATSTIFCQRSQFGAIKIGHVTPQIVLRQMKSYLYKRNWPLKRRAVWPTVQPQRVRMISWHRTYTHIQTHTHTHTHVYIMVTLIRLPVIDERVRKNADGEQSH